MNSASPHSSSPSPKGESEATRIRRAYLESGRLPYSILIKLALRGVFVEPLWLPIKYLGGAVGFKIRQLIYRRSLRSFGKGSLIEIGVEIPRPKSVDIGEYTYVDRYVQLTAPEGSISIGGRCHLAPFVMVLGHGTVQIGNCVGIASNAKIFSVSDWPAAGKRLCGPMIPAEHRHLKYGPVVIEDDVFIGPNVVVMPGITIGRGAIVGANAVVTKNVSPWTVVGGIPARPMANREPLEPFETLSAPKHIQ